MDSSLGIVLSPAELVASAGVLTSPAGILSLAAAALIVFAAVWTLRFRPRGFPPGPPPLPFLGNVYPGSRPRHDKIDAIREIYPKGGAVLSLSLNGVRAAVLVSDYRVFEEDIKGRAAKVLGNRPRIPLMEIGNFNKGISMSNGAHWLATRKFALGAMRENGMGKKSLVKDIAFEADILVGKMKDLGGSGWDPKLGIQKSVANIIATLAFGRRFKEDDPGFNMIMAILSSGPFDHDSLGMRLMTSYAGIILRMIPVSLLAAADPLVDVFLRFKDFVSQEIEINKVSLDPNNPRSVIDLYLLEMQSGTAPEALKDPETLVASIMDLFSAGSDTTATTIGWVLQALAKYPKIQERLRSEILRVVGSKGIPEPSDLAKMPYLHAVVFEAMRFRSLVPIGVEHCTTQDITIGGYRVPANSTVFVNQKAIHEDPRYWKDVTSFNPDNFLTADGEIHVPQQFMPFGWGSRVCIGQPLAKMELLVFLTRILQGLKISPVPSKPVTLESVGDIVLRPADLELLFEPFQ